MTEDEGGADAHSLRDLGGWRSPASVRHYVALNPEHLRSTLARLRRTEAPMELGWILLLTVSLANAPDRTTLDFSTLSACQSAGAALAKELGRPTPKGLPAVSAICINRATGEMFWALPTALGPVR